MGLAIFFECQDYRSVQHVIYESSPCLGDRALFLVVRSFEITIAIATRRVVSIVRFDIRDVANAATL